MVLRADTAAAEGGKHVPNVSSRCQRFRETMCYSDKRPERRRAGRGNDQFFNSEPDCEGLFGKEELINILSTEIPQRVRNLQVASITDGSCIEGDGRSKIPTQ